MSVDVRVKMLCNLGNVISGEVSDSPMSEKGLLKSSGQIVVEGFENQPRGTDVLLAYYQPQANRVTRFPRRLRVLKSCTDPFRNTTTYEVGCLLTMLEQVRSDSDVYYAGTHKPDWWDSQQFSDDIYTYRAPNHWCKSVRDVNYSGWGGTEYSYKVTTWRRILPTIQSQYLLEYACSKLKLHLASGNRRLAFEFLKESVDFTGGYLDLIDKLIVSEGCYGFLNQDEQLVVKPFDLRVGGSAAVLTEERLIDLQPISGGREDANVTRVNFTSKRRLSTAGKYLGGS